MTEVSAARSVLLDLAQYLRPKVAADLDADEALLMVECETHTIQVEVIATVTTTSTRVFYRDAKSWRVYGSVAEPETVVAAILAELEGHPHA